MKNKNLILGGMLALLVLMIMLPRVLPEKRDYPKRLAEVDTSRVSRVEIVKGADSIVVEKQELEWRLRHPMDWRADARTAEGLLGILGDLGVAALANANLNLAEDARYGLDLGGATRIRVYAGDEMVLHARLGRASQDYSGSFARLEGKAPIYRLSQALGGRVPATTGRWLDKIIYQVPEDSLTGIELDRADGRLAFAGSDTIWTSSWQPAKGRGWSAAPVNPESFNQLKLALATLRMSDLAGPAQSARLDSAAVLLTHRFQTADGHGQSIQWARLEDEPNLVFARKEGEATWFALYAGLLDRLLTKAEDFRRTE